MTEQDHEAIVTIACLAAQADGRTTPDEQLRLRAAAARFGIPEFDAAEPVEGTLSDLSRRLSGDDAHRVAYETAVAVCHADGPPNELETRFLDRLRSALTLDPAALGQIDQQAAALTGGSVSAAAVEVSSGRPPGDADLDDLILKQAMIAGAVELLPDKLATLAILPLQLHLVYQIGRRYGQQLDGNQVKDLAATLGLGAASQMMEQVVRRVVGGVAGGLLGGLLGGAGGLAAGVAVTFATTYALGHVAKQYYAQGRRISATDLRALFGRFQEDAKTLFPKVQQQIHTQAKSLNLQNLVREMR
jgi:uncharacterized protein (DUF697 family)/tellurite resistance protein